MADDLDDLLDEVETKFFVKKKSKVETKDIKTEKHCQQQLNAHKQNHHRIKSKLDRDVDDILGLDVETPPRKEKPEENDFSNKYARTPSSVLDKKCYPVYVGGTLCDQGLGSSVSKRVCNRLRCTSCDFKVSIFPDYEWNSNTDYLFLRNNAPDYQKLKCNLNRRKGCCAYSCQCSWRNYEELVELKDPKLKWVCGKH